MASAIGFDVRSFSRRLVLRRSQIGPLVLRLRAGHRLNVTGLVFFGRREVGARPLEYLRRHAD